MAKITPELIVTFETNIKSISTGNWQRVQENLMWDTCMKPRPTESKVETIVWLLETARIQPEGPGGNKRFDDMAAATTSIDNGHAGAGLELTKDEIEDNQMTRGEKGTVATMDYATKWAKDIGGASAYYPQQKLFELIAAGSTTGKAYDGLAFFHAAHPVNPNGGGPTYSNIIANVPITVTTGATEVENLMIARKNLGKAVAAIMKQKFNNGVPRFLKPRTLFVQSDMFDYANLVVSAGLIAATDNVRKAKLEVVACPELDTLAAGTYFIGVEDILSDELGAFIWSEREPFYVSTYGPVDQYALKRMNRFSWELDGRNGAFYGHPYLFYKCNPS